MTEIEQIKSMLEAGMPKRRIARMLPYKEYVAMAMMQYLQQSGELPKRKKGTKMALCADAARKGMTCREISNEYGIGIRTVRNYLSLMGVKANKPKKYESHKKRQCSAQTDAIKERIKKNEPLSEIARYYGISRQRVFIIKQRMDEDKE